MRFRWVMLVALLAGCEDPEPPSPFRSSAAPLPAVSLAPVASAAVQRQRTQPNQDTMKKLRAELCYYGGFGVIYARDAYWESLGKEAPSAAHLPSFGDYPEYHASAPGDVTSAKRLGSLPFEGHLRACDVAARLAKGKWPELDAALGTFAPQSVSAARVLSHAAGYYAREEYQRDAFASGKESHQQIEDTLASFHEQHQAFGKALAGWLANVEPTDAEKQRDELGTLSGAATESARVVVQLLLAPTPDAAAVSTALQALSAAKEKVSAAGPQASLLERDLTALIAAANALPATPSSRDRYLLATAFASVLEADGRVLHSALRRNVRTPNARLPSERALRQPRKPGGTSAAPLEEAPR